MTNWKYISTCTIVHVVNLKKCWISDELLKCMRIAVQRRYQPRQNNNRKLIKLMQNFPAVFISEVMQDITDFHM